jgi:hypothetical protein
VLSAPITPQVTLLASVSHLETPPAVSPEQIKDEGNNRDMATSRPDRTRSSKLMIRTLEIATTATLPESASFGRWFYIRGVGVCRCEANQRHPSAELGAVMVLKYGTCVAFARRRNGTIIRPWVDYRKGLREPRPLASMPARFLWAEGDCRSPIARMLARPRCASSVHQKLSHLCGM